MKNLPEKIYLNLNMTPQEVVETKDKDFHEATKTWEITWSEEYLSEYDPEYVCTDATSTPTVWEELGTTIDLSAYATTAYVEDKLTWKTF